MNDIQTKDSRRRPDLDDGREIPRQKDLVGLFKPDGGHSHIYHNHTDMLSRRCNTASPPGKASLATCREKMLRPNTPLREAVPLICHERASASR